MTVYTIDDVLSGSYDLIIAIMTAVVGVAAAIVGLMMLKFLVDIVTGATKKVRRI
jgi:hypothetical protein